MAFRLIHPWWLLLLPTVVPAFLAWRRHLRSPGVPRLMRSVAWLRACALLALVLALAGGEYIARQRSVDVFFAVDISHSIAPAAQETALEVVRNAAKQAGRADRTAVIAFAGGALLEQSLGKFTGIRTIESMLPKDDTSIYSALRMALDAAQAGRNTRVVLLSDGLETRDAAETLLEQLQMRNIPVDFFPLGSRPENEVSVEQVTAPSHVGRDQPFHIPVVAAATTATAARLRLFRDGSLFSDKAVELHPGRNVFDYTGMKEKSGVHRFEARLEAAADTATANNAGQVSVIIEGPNRMLLVTENAGASAAMISGLRQQGVLLDTATPQTLPAGATALGTYAAILLHDVSALRLSQTQQQQIASYVRDLGGGLIAVGGHNSFGLGGYYKTPLEEALPVSMEAPQTLVMPSLALVLVIDHSGSMGEQQGGFKKIDLAKEAALGVVDVLSEHDLFGVLAFDDTQVWTVPIQPAADRTAFARQISLLAPGGGTDMGPAMSAAYTALAGTQAMVKHVVVLSDGLSLEADFPAITKKMRAAAITVSTVAVGKGADVNLLNQIAQDGGGRYHYTDDPRAIPQIFANEALIVTRPLAVEEPFQPQVAASAPFLSGSSLRSIPRLDGYVLTTPKNTAQVFLESEDGNPVLAAWRYGLGRAVAFTSGATTTWATAWLKWAGFAPFWAQTARWAMRPETSSPLKPVLELYEGQGFLTVDTLDKQGQFINFLDLSAEIISPSGARQNVQLAQTAPGHYQAQFAASEQGAWLAAVTAGNDPRYSQPALVGAALPYSAEYRLLGLDAGLPIRLAAQTGGIVFPAGRIPSPAELRRLYQHPAPIQTAVSLWPLLLAAAFFLFMLDIALRYLPTATLERWELRLRQAPLVWLLYARHPLPQPQPAPAPLAEATVNDEEEEEPEPVPASAVVAAKPTRLDDLVQTRRLARLTDEPDTLPTYKLGAGALAAARYLAQRRHQVQTPAAPADATGETPPEQSTPDERQGA